MGEGRWISGLAARLVPESRINLKINNNEALRVTQGSMVATCQGNRVIITCKILYLKGCFSKFLDEKTRGYLNLKLNSSIIKLSELNLRGNRKEGLQGKRSTNPGCWVNLWK